MNNQRSRMFRESARYTSSKETSNNTTNSIKGKPQQTKIRCKYCHRLGHTDYDCQSKAQKRPPSMPEWVSKAICSKCKKRGHLSFNCPPKYACKVIKVNKSRPKNKLRNTNNLKNLTKDQSESADHVTEFAGMAYVTKDQEDLNHSHKLSKRRNPKTHYKHFSNNHRSYNKIYNQNKRHQLAKLQNPYPPGKRSKRSHSSLSPGNETRN